MQTAELLLSSTSNSGLVIVPSERQSLSQLNVAPQTPEIRAVAEKIFSPPAPPSVERTMADYEVSHQPTPSLPLPNASSSSSLTDNVGVTQAPRQPLRSSLLDTLSRVIRLALRYFGGNEFSIPGLILRLITLQIIVDLVRYGSLKKALFGVPLSKTTYVDTDLDENQLQSVKEGLRFSSLTAAIHGQSPEWINEARINSFDPLNPRTLEIPLQQGEISTDTCIFDPKTGLKVMFFRDQRTNNLTVVFGALGSLENSDLLPDRERFSNAVETSLHESRITQLKTVATNLLGVRPTVFLQAADLVRRVRDLYPSENIHCVGQCFGGALATFSALKNASKATTFNALALGAGLQADLTRPQIERSLEDIRVYSARTDFISNPHRAIWASGRVANLLGIRTPMVLGQQIVIPTAYKKRQETHDYMTGSLAAFMSQKLPPQQDGVCIDAQAATRMKPSEILSRFDSPNLYSLEVAAG